MKSDKYLSLADIAIIYDSKRIPLNSRERSQRKGDIPYYGAQGIVDHIDDFIFDGDYVLIAEDGENLKSRKQPIAFRARGKFWVNNHAHIVLGNEPWINDYIEAFFHYTDISQYVTGAAQPKLNQGNLLKIKIPFEETLSKELANTWSLLQQKIELNNQIKETLEQIGQTLFKKYFVDNPESKGWDTKPLDEVADFKNGLACQKYPAAKGDQTLRVIKIKEMSSGFTTNSDVVGSSFPSDYIIENGDLLFAWSGTLMTKIWTEGPGALNQHIFKVTSNEYSKWFYYQWVNEHLERFVMIAKSKAVTMGHIKRSHLSEVSVKIPPKEHLDKFDGLLSSFLDKQISSAIENNTLISLRNNLLPKLMSGEISV